MNEHLCLIVWRGREYRIRVKLRKRDAKVVWRITGGSVPVALPEPVLDSMIAEQLMPQIVEMRKQPEDRRVCKFVEVFPFSEMKEMLPAR